MTGNTVSEILNVERTFEAACEEAAERCYERCKSRHDESMQLETSVWQFLNHQTSTKQNLCNWGDDARQSLGNGWWERVSLPEECVIGLAFHI